ncbi:MAG: hypothetical protein WD490_08645 [Opitutales bacterium]
MILFGMVQYVLMLTATEVIQYSADAAVRARAVGLNSFMVRKASLVASIPNAGQIDSQFQNVIGPTGWSATNASEAFDRSTDSVSSGSSQFQLIEEHLLGDFLGAETESRMYGILDYDDWDTVRWPIYSRNGTMLRVTIIQDYPLRMPFRRAFTTRDELRIQREARLADHAELYLQ